MRKAEKDQEQRYIAHTLDIHLKFGPRDMRFGVELTESVETTDGVRDCIARVVVAEVVGMSTSDDAELVVPMRWRWILEHVQQDLRLRGSCLGLAQVT